jgi:hypothetical protein
MQRDLYSNYRFFDALEPANRAPSSVINGNRIDLQGYEGVTVIFHVGAHNNVSTASYTDLILQHGLLESDAGVSVWSDVPASNMIHSVYNLDSTTNTGLVKRLNDSGMGSAVYIVGYRGKARYLRVRLSANAATQSGLFAATALIGYPSEWPVNEPA